MTFGPGRSGVCQIDYWRVAGEKPPYMNGVKNAVSVVLNASYHGPHTLPLILLPVDFYTGDGAPEPGWLEPMSVGS